MNKLLTIVIPVYNTEVYLSKCIESLIVPNYMDTLEIIIVIDGSPDNSLQIAEEYESKYPNTIKVVNKENGGHGSTINKGLELATGKYFRVLDSDDWFNTDNFKIYLSKLSKSDEDVVMTHLSKEYIYENRSEMWKTDNINFDYIYNCDTFTFTDLSIGFFGMGRCTYKTKLLKEHHLCLLEKVYFEDSYLHVFPMIFIKSFVFYDLTIYHYFIGRPNQSISAEVSLKHNNDWQLLIRQIVDFYAANKKNLSNKKEAFIFKVLKQYVSMQYSQINKFDYNTSKKELDKFDKYISSLSFTSKITDTKKLVYSITPYWLYRQIYYLGVRYLNFKRKIKL